MHEFNEIPNDCDREPYYKVYFQRTDSSFGFWIAAHLGTPGQVLLPKPGTTPPENPIEIKGVIFICKRPLVIYDFKNSDGHGLYNPLDVSKDKIKSFSATPDTCSNAFEPEAWYFEVTKDSIYLANKREPFKLE